MPDTPPDSPPESPQAADLPQLDGPRMDPASGQPAKQLVILSHGYGSDGADLIGLAQHWAGLLPDAAFVSPNGPQRCPSSPTGYQWWDIGSFSQEERLAGVRSAAPILDKFIDQELSSLGLGDEDLALVGFSQGTMMSLHVGLRRSQTPACILGYSGALVGAELLATEATAKPPIMMIHGDSDQMLPATAMQQAVQELGQAGFSVDWHISPGLGHGVDPTGLHLGGEFIAKHMIK